MKKGIEKSPHRSLFKAMGYTDEEIDRPLIGIVNSANEIIPGHIHLNQIAQAVKAGVRMAGGTPMEFSTIGVCDGIAMNHEGMKYSLASRELIADSVEVMAMAHPFDALVLIPNCDKIIPGMLMAMLRLNIPAIMISGGPMLTGRWRKKERSSGQRLRRGRSGQVRDDEGPRSAGAGRRGLSGVWFLRRYVYGQFHELSDRGHGSGIAGKWNHSRRIRGPHSFGQTGRHEGHGSIEKKYPPPGYCHHGRLQKRHRRRHGLGLFHQYGAPCSGHGP